MARGRLGVTRPIARAAGAKGEPEGETAPFGFPLGGCRGAAPQETDRTHTQRLRVIPSRRLRGFAPAPREGRTRGALVLPSHSHLRAPEPGKLASSPSLAGNIGRSRPPSTVGVGCPAEKKDREEGGKVKGEREKVAKRRAAERDLGGCGRSPAGDLSCSPANGCEQFRRAGCGAAQSAPQPARESYGRDATARCIIRRLVRRAPGAGGAIVALGVAS